MCTFPLSGEDDFVPVSTALRFKRCDNRSCTNISIQSDEIMEGTETFTITLDPTFGLDPRIQLDPFEGVVTIIDDFQSKQVNMKFEVYIQYGNCIKMTRNKIGTHTNYDTSTYLCWYIECPNLVSVHFLMQSLYNYYFPNFFIYLSLVLFLLL